MVPGNAAAPLGLPMLDQQRSIEKACHGLPTASQMNGDHAWVSRGDSGPQQFPVPMDKTRAATMH
jgi:hypothetical protein